MALPVLSANSPSAGFISWTSFGISYGDKNVTIPAGNTSKRYVYWLWNNGNPASAVQAADALPTNLTADDLVLFVNRGGLPVNAQSANVIEGSLIATESIIGDSIAANTIEGVKIKADAITSREVQAGAITAAELSISSWGGAFAINGDMDDVDPVTKVPAGWSAGFEGTGQAFYSQETMAPLSGQTSVAITLPANGVEALASKAVPVKGGDLIRFGTAFRTSVTGVPITLRAYFSASPDFTAAQVISGTPDTPQDIYIFDVSGAGLAPRDDLPTPLVGPGIAAMVEGWPTPVTTPLYVSGQFRVPAGARYVRFVLASGLTTGSSPSHTVIWDAMDADSVVTGIKMADGAITAEKIAVGAVTADAVAAGAIQTEHLAAGVVTAEALAANIALIGAITSGVSGRRWEADPDGIRVYDDSGAAIINFPTDISNGGNTIKGELTATLLTVEDNLKIMGLTNEVSKGSRLVLSSGTTSPSSSPTLTLDWESYGPVADKTFDPYKRGLGLYNGKYYYAQDVYAQKTNVQRMDAATGAREWYGYQLSTVTWAEGGCTVLGGIFYALGKRADGTTWAVDKFNLSTNANAGSWTWAAPATLSNEPAIGNDGTNILIGYTLTDGTVKWEARNPSTGALVSTVTTNAGTSRGVTAIMGGNFDYGSARVIMQFKDAPEFGQVFNSTGVRQTNDEWMLATGAKPRGATWDSVRGQFVSYDPNAAKLHFYTGVKWTTESSTWWASYTWANPSTSSETQQSTRRSITMKKRARLLVSVPARPVTDAAVTHSRIYLGRAGSDPGRTAMWKQGGDITGTTMLLSSVAFSGTNPPSASSFSTSAPARVESGAGNLVLNGDGSGSAGAITWGTTATSVTTIGAAVNVSGGITSSDGNGGVLVAGSLTTQGEPSVRLRRQSSNGTDQYEGYIYMWSGVTPALSLQHRKNGAVVNRLDITDGYTSTDDEFRAPKIKTGSGDAHGTNYAEVSRNTAQACGTGVWTTISFNTWGARFEDDGGLYTSSHWRSQKAGFFVCASSVTFATAGTGHRSMRIITEGGTVLSRDGFDQGTTPFRDIHTSVACALPGGAYGIRTEVYQNSGASINTAVHSSTEPCISRFGQAA